MIAAGHIFVTLALATTGVVSHLDSNQPKEKDEAREKVAAAQERFQQDMYEIMASRWPHLEELMRLQRDLQIALKEARTFRFYFLLEHDPGRIVRDEGVAAFINFDWSDEDDDQLRAVSPEYAALEKRMEELQRQSDGHPDWPAAREKAKSLQGQPDFQEARERLSGAWQEVEELLQAE